jgi:signal transduction histidine kinase
MRWPPRFRSLLAQFTLRVIVPLSLVMFGVIAASLYAYQQVVTSLLIDRDHQLAVLSAARVSEAVEGYARVLEALATSPEVQSHSAEMRATALEDAADALQFFDAGVVIVDRDGAMLTVAPPGSSPVGETVAGQDDFRSVREGLGPAFSNVVSHIRNGQDMIMIAVPILDGQEAFAGALLGAVYLNSTPLGDTVRQLAIGEKGFAYVVDGGGRVIFHPDPENIGADFADRPFVKNVMAGESGGLLWRAPTGEPYVSGYVPIQNTGWGLIVREPWNSVVAPAQLYGAVTMLIGLAAAGVAAYLLWRGVRRIATPLRLLAEQSARLAAGEALAPVAESQITEIDALGRDFSRMAAQIESYRAGLRRYVGAITHSQEEGRRRLARELHDETTQGLLTIARRLELYQASESDPERQARLAELQTMVSDTLRGLRQISRDLRPLVLEDLGLIPALRTLVRAAREGVGAVPHARLEVSGQPVSLGAEQELALYRITQEALTNIRKHARATGARVDVSLDSSAVRLDIHDDGWGFEVPGSLNEFAQRGSFGLMGIQERVWAVGGSLTIKSTPGHGTWLSVTMPIGH